MRRLLLATILAALGGVAAADTVHLRDGRKLEGELTDLGGQYELKMKFGTLKVNKADVLRIEKAVNKGDLYKQKLDGLSAVDAQGHFELGQWCRQNELADEAKAAFEKAVAIDANHAGARRELGYLKVGEKWQTAGSMMRSAEALSKLGKLEQSSEILKQLAAVGDPKDVGKDAALALARIYEKLGKWQDAASTYKAAEQMLLAPKEKTLARVRCEIIESHPDGMYLVKEEAAASTLLSLDDGKGGKAPQAKGGMQPLSDEKVMAAALRDKARAIVDQGRRVFEEAKKVDVVDSDKALKLFDEAGVYFDQANFLVPDIARSYNVEIVRKKIGAQQKKAMNYLIQFTAVPEPSVQVLAGSRRMTAKGRKDWGEYISKLESLLKAAEKHQDQILALAQAYPDELADTIAQTKKLDDDIEKLKGIMKQQRSREGL